MEFFERKSMNIYKLASMAGVSVATVSIVINGKEGVGQETRERILKLIDEYDFFPLYRGIETYQTAAFVGTVGKDIDVFRILYQCTALDKQSLEDEYVMFDSKQINLVPT